MSNQSVRMNLNMDGRETTKVEVIGSLIGQGLNMQMGKKMWLRKRDLTRLDRDTDHNNGKIEVRALVGWSVRHVVRNTFGEIVHNIRVESLRYTMHGGANCWGCWPEHSMYLCNDGQRVSRTPDIYHLKMDGKLCDQVISILIDPITNYSYVSPNLVDKCGLSKQLHAESKVSLVGYGYKEASASLGKILHI